MRIKNGIFVAGLAIALATAGTGVSAKEAPTCKVGKPAANIAVAKNFYKATETGDIELLSNTLAEDYRSEPVTPGAPEGLKGAIERNKFIQATFGPTSIENLEFLTSGNKVIVRSEISATHSGPFVGLAPTGKKFKFGAIDIHTICNGKIVLGHHEENWMAVMFQLGILPVKPAN